MWLGLGGLQAAYLAARDLSKTVLGECGWWRSMALFTVAA